MDDCGCACVHADVFIFILDRSLFSLSPNEPTHSLLFPQGMEIVRGINGESGGREKS